MLGAKRSWPLRKQPFVSEKRTLRHHRLQRSAINDLGERAQRHQRRIPNGFGIGLAAANEEFDIVTAE